VKGDLAAIWKDQQNTKMLTNMHHPPAEGNIYSEYKNAVKQATVQDCNKRKSKRQA
jgi:hypothetical protein